MTFSRYFLASITALAITACVETETTDTDIDANKGKQIFAENCAACHGDPSAGTAPLAEIAGRTPPDLALLSQNNGGVFPQDYVMSTIDGFGRTDHHGNPMPEFGIDGLGPVIMVERDGLLTPVPAQLLALAAYIESFQE